MTTIPDFYGTGKKRHLYFDIPIFLLMCRYKKSYKAWPNQGRIRYRYGFLSDFVLLPKALSGDGTAIFLAYMIIYKFVQDELGKKVDTYSFKYILPETAKKKDKGKEKEGKKSKGDDGEAYKEAIRDTKISWLAKLPAESKEAKVIASFPVYQC